MADKLTFETHTLPGDFEEKNLGYFLRNASAILERHKGNSTIPYCELDDLMNSFHDMMLGAFQKHHDMRKPVDNG